MENNKKVATSNQRIRELIESLNISQVEFCEKTGLKTSALSNYLNDNRTPRQDAISKIADAYNVSPTWIMGYDVPKNIESRTLIVKENDAEYFQIYAPMHKYESFSNLIQAAEDCTPEQIDLATRMMAEFRNLNFKLKED